jgi:hypothetical protein
MAAGDGLVSMTPTSIAHSGTSASINADGGVDFSAVTSLSLNGVFTSAHDNYLVVIRHQASSGTGIDFRLRASGSDNSTSNSYVLQYIASDGSNTAGGRTTSNIASDLSASYPTQRDGTHIYLYGPYLAQPTAGRSVTGLGYTSAYLLDSAFTHDQSTSYDGFTLTTDSTQTLTGNIVVFGYEE